MNGEQQSQGSDGLLPSGQVVHGHEPLPRGHTVVVDPPQVGLLQVVSSQDGLVCVLGGGGEDTHAHIQYVHMLVCQCVCRMCVCRMCVKFVCRYTVHAQMLVCQCVFCVCVECVCVCVCVSVCVEC